MTVVNALSLDGDMNFEVLGVRPLDDEEMASIAGGNPFVGVWMLLGAGAVACVIGLAVGVAVYYIVNN